MASTNQISEAFRKISMVSTDSNNAKKLYPIKDVSPPRDKFYITQIIFILFGILHIVPDTFFVTANEYWMYKFRDISSQIVDSNNRTVLQANFTSVSSVVRSISNIITMILFISFRHKIDVKFNIYLALTVTVSCFVLFTGFIFMNTDPWQTSFFILTMGGLAIISISLTSFQLSSLIVLSKFPANYMKIFLFGKGITGIFTSFLQVISLSIGTSIEASACIYFLVGTLLILSTLVLYIINSTCMPFYTYCTVNSKEDIKRKVSFTVAEVIMVSKEIWTALSIYIISVASIVLIHPNMTTLVVSEGYGQGNLWNDKYFVPVITFFLSDGSQLIGRLCAADVIKHPVGPWLVVLEALRMIFVPLIMFCNLLPRHLLPVLFTHDWQYIIILTMYHILCGFVFSSVFLSIPRQTKHEELSYLLLLIGVAVTTAIFSFVSTLIINLI